jgi:hypothetical protein
MSSKHSLSGLIKFSTREPWSDRFEQILEDHLMPACDEAGVEVDDVVGIIGQDMFMSTIWASAFEDFLTREFDDGENAIDDYLKRRGWKESASVRAYMAALRDSTMSLYEVSDIIRGTSFRARDLIRGGEPVLISERSATQRPWDHIAARVVRVGPKMQICGGVLVIDHGTSEAFIEAFRQLDSLSVEEKREIAEAEGQDFDEAALSELSPTQRLRAIAPMFTTSWLLDLFDRVQAPLVPELRNFDSDELMRCEVSYPLAAGTTNEDVRTGLQARPEFRSTSATSWNWVDQGKLAAARSDDGVSGEKSDLRDVAGRRRARPRRYPVGGPDSGAQCQLVTAFRPRMRAAVRNTRIARRPTVDQSRIGRANYRVARRRDAGTALYLRGGAVRHHPWLLGPALSRRAGSTDSYAWRGIPTRRGQN